MGKRKNDEAAGLPLRWDGVVILVGLVLVMEIAWRLFAPHPVGVEDVRGVERVYYGPVVQEGLGVVTVGVCVDEVGRGLALEIDEALAALYPEAVGFVWMVGADGEGVGYRAGRETDMAPIVAGGSCGV